MISSRIAGFKEYNLTTWTSTNRYDVLRREFDTVRGQIIQQSGTCCTLCGIILLLLRPVEPRHFL
jgi:hypothetical protein